MVAFTDSQQSSQKEFDMKFQKLARDVATAQQDATECALKKAKRGHSLEFKQKGKEVEGHLKAVTKKIKRALVA